MKKVLVVLLVLFVGAGLFAQEITPHGGIRLDFGGQTSNDGDKTSGNYVFNAQNAATGLGLKYTNENIEADVTWSYGDNPSAITGYGKATLADMLDVKIGFGWLPSASWSPLAIHGNSNYSIGATSLGQAGYLQLGAFGAYLGVAETKNLTVVNENFTPVFYLGYDYTAESNFLSLGATFTAQSAGEYFPFLATVHGRVSPSETIHILFNVGLYKMPSAFDIGAPVISNGIVGDSYGSGADRLSNAGVEDSMVLEAFIGANIGITETLGVDFTVGYKTDVSKAEVTPAQAQIGVGYLGGGSMLQVGLDLPIDLGNGFKIIPGVTFAKLLTLPGGSDMADLLDLMNQANPAEGFTLQYGVSLKYSF